MKRWARANHQPNLPLESGRYVTACKEHVLLSKEAATEGMVLLKNENNILPVTKEKYRKKHMAFR
jgi:beta-glucosidase